MSIKINNSKEYNGQCMDIENLTTTTTIIINRVEKVALIGQSSQQPKDLVMVIQFSVVQPS